MREGGREEGWWTSCVLIIEGPELLYQPRQQLIATSPQQIFLVSSSSSPPSLSTRCCSWPSTWLQLLLLLHFISNGCQVTCCSLQLSAIKSKKSTCVHWIYAVEYLYHRAAQHCHKDWSLPDCDAAHSHQGFPPQHNTAHEGQVSSPPSQSSVYKTLICDHSIFNHRQLWCGYLNSCSCSQNEVPLAGAEGPVVMGDGALSLEQQGTGLPKESLELMKAKHARGSP